MHNVWCRKLVELILCGRIVVIIHSMGESEGHIVHFKVLFKHHVTLALLAQDLPVMVTRTPFCDFLDYERTVEKVGVSFTQHC